MKALSTRQFYYILILSMLSLKFMALPSLLYSIAGRDSYLIVFMSLLVEFLFFWFFIELICKYPNITFDKLLKMKLGKVCSKLFFILLGIYFFIKTTTAIEGVYVFFKENLFEDLEPIIFIVPMFSILIYLTSKGLNCLARTLEILFYIIATGLIFSGILAIFSIDFYNILPFMENGFTPLFNGMFKYNFWFGDFLILTLFMGRIKQTKKFKKNTFLIWWFMAIFIVIFIFMFNAIFGNMASYHRLAISDLAQYSFNYVTSIQVDWFPILLWTLGLFYQSAIGFWLTSKCFRNVFTPKAKGWIITIITILIVIILTYIKFDVNKVVTICSEYINYYSLAIYIITFIFGILCLKTVKGRAKNEYAFKKTF